MILLMFVAIRNQDSALWGGQRTAFLIAYLETENDGWSKARTCSGTGRMPA